MPRWQNFFDYLLDIYLHARKKLLYIYFSKEQHQAKSVSRPAGCVISDSSGPRLLRWVWGLQWPGLQHRPNSRASAALQMSHGHCSHQPSVTITNVPSSQWLQRVTFTVTAFTQSMHSRHNLLHARGVTSGSVTPTLMSLPWPLAHTEGAWAARAGNGSSFYQTPWLNTRNCFLD